MSMLILPGVASMPSGAICPTTKGSFGAASRDRKNAMSLSSCALYPEVDSEELFSPWCQRTPLRSTVRPGAFAAAMPSWVCRTASSGRSSAEEVAAPTDQVRVDVLLVNPVPPCAAGMIRTPTLAGWVFRYSRAKVVAGEIPLAVSCMSKGTLAVRNLRSFAPYWKIRGSAGSSVVPAGRPRPDMFDCPAARNTCRTVTVSAARAGVTPASIRAETTRPTSRPRNTLAIFPITDPHSVSRAAQHPSLQRSRPSPH